MPVDQRKCPATYSSCLTFKLPNFTFTVRKMQQVLCPCLPLVCRSITLQHAAVAWLALTWDMSPVLKLFALHHFRNSEPTISCATFLQFVGLLLVKGQQYTTSAWGCYAAGLALDALAPFVTSSPSAGGPSNLPSDVQAYWQARGSRRRATPSWPSLGLP